MAIVRDPATGKYVSTNDLQTRGVTLPTRDRTQSRPSRGSFANQPETQPTQGSLPTREEPQQGILKSIVKGVIGGVTQPVQYTAELGATIGKGLSDSPIGRATQPIFNFIADKTGLTNERVTSFDRSFRGLDAPRGIDKYNPLNFGETFSGERTGIIRPFQEQGIKPFLGKTLETAFNIGTGVFGGKAVGAGAQAVKLGSREALRALAREGAKTGLKLGGVAGLGAGLQRDQDFLGITGSTLAGAGGGAVIGAGLPVLTNLGVRGFQRAGSILGPQITERIGRLFSREAGEELAEQAARRGASLTDEITGGSIRSQDDLIRGLQGQLQDTTALLPERAQSAIGREVVEEGSSVLPTEISDQLNRLRLRTVTIPQQVQEELVQQGVARGLLSEISEGSAGFSSRFSDDAVNDVIARLNKIEPDLAKVTDRTLTENIVARNTLRQQLEAEFGKKGPLSGLVKESKQKLVDFTSPVEDVLNRSEREGLFSIRPQEDVRLQFDRIFRSPTLANRFLRDAGFVDVVQEAERRGVVNQLSEFLIARQSEDIRFARPDVDLGRSATQDQRIINTFQDELGDLATRVNQFSRDLLDRSVEGGLVAKEAADNLKQVFPNYVPVNRVFSAIEQEGRTFARGKGAGSLASVAQQSVVQELKGSRRAIQNPLQSLIERTHDVVVQSERNRAAQQMSTYRNLPGNPFGIKELLGDSKPGVGKGKFNAIIDGVKRSFEVDEEFAAVIAAASPQQIGLIGRILAFPVRVAKAGITGLNIPFTVTNFFRDQITGLTNSNAAASTSLNPLVFTKALFSSLKHDDLYDAAVRSGAMTTSFDLLRNQASDTLQSIRATSSIGSRIKFAIKDPVNFIKRTGRGVENIIARSEEVRRLQEFQGVRQSLLKQGASQETADLLGADAARWVTANFFRRGEWGQALNSAFLYLNAGVQGNRAFLRAFRDRPAATTAKVVSSVFIPLASLTAWNLLDPKRRQAYEDIREFEKDNNLVLIPNNPTQDENGRWNVYKLPVPPNLAALTIPVRKMIESSHGLDPVRFRDFAQGLIGSVSPITPDFDNRRKFSSSILSATTPQAIRPSIEAFANRQFFTDSPIEPDFIEGVPTKDLPPELRVRDNTSGTVRGIAGVLGFSPIQTEQFIKSTFGGAGSQALNALDRVAARLGFIPEDQIGGEGVRANLSRRLLRATGGNERSDNFEIVEQLKREAGTERFLLKREAMEIVEGLVGVNGELPRRAPVELRRADPALYEEVNKEITDRRNGLSETDRLLKGLGVQNGTRTQFILELEKGMSDSEIIEFERELRRNKIISSEIRRQLREQRRSSFSLPQRGQQQGVSLPQR